MDSDTNPWARQSWSRSARRAATRCFRLRLFRRAPLPQISARESPPAAIWLLLLGASHRRRPPQVPGAATALCASVLAAAAPRAASLPCSGPRGPRNTSTADRPRDCPSRCKYARAVPIYRAPILIPPSRSSEKQCRMQLDLEPVPCAGARLTWPTPAALDGSICASNASSLRDLPFRALGLFSHFECTPPYVSWQAAVHK